MATFNIGQCRETPEVIIPFTTSRLTRAALDKADQLLLELDVTIRLISVQVVPFSLPIYSPLVSNSFFKIATHHLTSRSSARAELYRTREPESVWASCLKPNSLIVIATPRRLWRTPQEKLARVLRRSGHDVLCFIVKESLLPDDA